MYECTPWPCIEIYSLAGLVYVVHIEKISMARETIIIALKRLIN